MLGKISVIFLYDTSTVCPHVRGDNIQASAYNYVTPPSTVYSFLSMKYFELKSAISGRGIIILVRHMYFHIRVSLRCKLYFTTLECIYV